MVGREEFFQVEARFPVVAAKAGQVSYDDGIHFALLDHADHSTEGRAAEGGAGIAVVGKMGEGDMSVAGSVGLQVFSLIPDADGFAGSIVVDGQAFI